METSKTPQRPVVNYKPRPISQSALQKNTTPIRRPQNVPSIQPVKKKEEEVTELEAPSNDTVPQPMLKKPEPKHQPEPGNYTPTTLSNSSYSDAMTNKKSTVGGTVKPSSSSVQNNFSGFMNYRQGYNDNYDDYNAVPDSIKQRQYASSSFAKEHSSLYSEPIQHYSRFLKS